MKTLKSLFFTAIISFLLFSCNQKQEQITEIRENLMKIHDEEMAKMDEVMKLKKSLMVLSNDSLKEDAEKANIKASLEYLKTADKAMMDWMHDYDEPEENMSKEDQKKYFEAELIKMKAVKTQMDESIEAAKLTLKNYENK